MGCIARLGCLAILAILAVCAWLTRDRIFDRRRKSRTGERGDWEASTCSNLNFSLQAMIGRQTIWSISTITATMVRMPSTMERVSPLSAAACR